MLKVENEYETPTDWNYYQKKIIVSYPQEPDDNLTNSAIFVANMSTSLLNANKDNKTTKLDYKNTDNQANF